MADQLDELAVADLGFWTWSDTKGVSAETSVIDRRAWRSGDPTNGGKRDGHLRAHLGRFCGGIESPDLLNDGTAPSRPARCRRRLGPRRLEQLATLSLTPGRNPRLLGVERYAFGRLFDGAGIGVGKERPPASSSISNRRIGWVKESTWA
jgi:hypothetical protein